MTYREFRQWSLEQRKQRGPRCTCGLSLADISKPYTENGKMFCCSDCAMAHQVDLAEDGTWLSLSDDY